MSEELVPNSDTPSIDLESIGDLIEFRNCAIDDIVRFYTKYFDKIFGKIAESLAANEEKSNKLKEMREKHLKEYESYIEKCLDKEIRQLLNDKTIATKLVYVSDNFVRFSVDSINVQTAVDPFRYQYIEQLKTFQQKVDERLQSKTKTLTELTENLNQTQESYESLRKSLQKKVLTIINKLDSIEIQDLELNPKTTN